MGQLFLPENLSKTSKQLRWNVCVHESSTCCCRPSCSLHITHGCLKSPRSLYLSFTFVHSFSFRWTRSWLIATRPNFSASKPNFVFFLMKLKISSLMFFIFYRELAIQNSIRLLLSRTLSVHRRNFSIVLLDLLFEIFISIILNYLIEFCRVKFESLRFTSPESTFDLICGNFIVGFLFFMQTFGSASKLLKSSCFMMWSWNAVEIRAWFILTFYSFFFHTR